MENIKLVCPFCRKKSILKNPAQYAGRILTVKCANPGCRKKFSKSIDELDQATDTTTIVGRIDDKSIGSVAWLLRMGDSGKMIEKREVVGKTFVIGRKSKSGRPVADFPLEDGYISRKHCIVRQVNFKADRVKAYTISDLGSTNKTFLNNQQLEPDQEVFLRDGDELILGKTRLCFCIENNGRDGGIN